MITNDDIKRAINVVDIPTSQFLSYYLGELKMREALRLHSPDVLLNFSRMTSFVTAIRIEINEYEIEKRYQS